MSPAVGCRTLHVFDPIQEAAIPTWVLYPAEGAEQVVEFGPYPLAVALEAPLVGQAVPVVVISHGNGGSPWTHRETAVHLVRAGFAVVLLEHPGNGRSNNRLASTAANLENRPRHVRLVLDAVLQGLGPQLRGSAVGVIGHSIGAYTALAVAGGAPMCLPTEATDGVARPVAVVPDARIGALVLLAPAAIWYQAEGALAGVQCPILLFSGALDRIAWPGVHAEIVVRGAARVEHRCVPNAGHFSFQSPFPPALNRPDFPPAQDPPGFDRAGFQPILNGAILAFLRSALG